MTSAWVIFLKEVTDIWRDRRALFMVMMISIAAGPILLLMLANMLANFEARAEKRIIVVQGIEHAPSLAVHLARETARVKAAPAEYENLIATAKLLDPVLVIPSNFEALWLAGAPLSVKIVTDSSNSQVQAGVNRIKRWLSSFAAERSALLQAMRGITPGAHEILSVEEHDLSSVRAQTVKVFGMMPFFFVLAAIYSIWGAGLDTTIGERERGTLESIKMTPVSNYMLALGKWAAVSVIGSAIASLAVLGFLPAHALMEGETLRSMLAFGWREAATGIALIVPLTGLFAAMLMLIGARARGLKQAQANATGFMLFVTILPLTIQAGELGSAAWHYWFPVIAQHNYILMLLRGELTAVSNIAVPALTCALGIVVTVLLIAREFKKS